MYTVLLVDDEHIVLDFLEQNIAWQQLGVGAILKASNGKQALDLIHQTPIDLLITDIQMPYMDGLTLLRAIRPTYANLHCILLTAYSEFEYARQALTLGVENYLLKPIQISELEDTIEKALDNLYTDQKNSDMLFRNNILFRWATGAISEEELSERANLLGINVYLPQYLALCLKKRDAACSLTRFRQDLAEELSGDAEVHTFWNNKDHYVMLIGGLRLDAAHIQAQAMAIAARLGVEGAVSVALGQIVTGSSRISLSYQDAYALLEKPSAADEEPAGESYSPIIRLALDYIHSNDAVHISIKDFCIKTKANMSYLGYLFKKETGVFFNDYLSRYRIRRSALLLRNTELKIGDIAGRVGFSSVSYFVQCFKKHMSLSPALYRAGQISVQDEGGGNPP